MILGVEPYPPSKDSGVDTLGAVPAYWEGPTGARSATDTWHRTAGAREDRTRGKDTIAAALWTEARARGDARRAAAEGVPIDGPIHGVRAGLAGHTIASKVIRTENVWDIDTGVGSPSGQLTITRIDTEAIEIMTMGIQRRSAGATR